jgi:hypothetical protein
MGEEDISEFRLSLSTIISAMLSPLGFILSYTFDASLQAPYSTMGK